MLAALASVVSVPAGLFGACCVGFGFDALGLHESTAMLFTAWLGTAVPTGIAIVVAQADFVSGSALVDRTRPFLGMAWIEWEGGAALVPGAFVQTRPAAQGVETLGGFETRHPDRSLLVRDALRVGVGVVTGTLGMLIAGMGFGVFFGGLDALEALAYREVYWLPLAAALPMGVLGLAARSVWQARRALDWTDSIMLEGTVLRTKRGDFHFRSPNWRAEVHEDVFGATLLLEDEDQHLRVRAPGGFLYWAVDRLQHVRVRDGSRADIPEALAELR